MVEAFYEGKNILVTGCTGFVGKVLLEKILYSLPQINRIYVFIRHKKNTIPSERFRKEIIDSPIFDRLRARELAFDDFIQAKVYPIEGDLQQEALALSPQDRQHLIDNVNIIMNSAASIDFNQRLDQALQINTLGTLRVIDLGKQCKNLVAFVQVSTAYVNCIQKGWVEEKIYPVSWKPRQLLQELLQLSVEEIERRTDDIINPYPNTYTFTKNLTENLIKDEVKDMPICIMRPSIIGSSWREPVPGWIDSVSAAGTFFFSIGLGILKVGLGNRKTILDQIPVDIVANGIIVAAAKLCKPNKVEILMLGTSSVNPVTLGTCADVSSNYWQKFPSSKAISSVSISFFSNLKAYEAMHKVRRQLPAWLFLKYGQLTGNQGVVKNALRFKKVLGRERVIGQVFSHFTLNDWIFSSQNLSALHKSLTRDEVLKFDLDITRIDWRVFLSNFCYGLKKFVLKEPADPPSADSTSLNINWDYRKRQYFSDITWAYNHGEPMFIRGLHEMKSMIVNAPKVQEVIRRLAEEDKNTSESALQKKAQHIIDRMACDLRMPMVRVFGWFLRKIWRTIYEKVEVNQEALMKLKELKIKNTGPIVLVPTHRSYIDFLIMSYVFFSFNIKMPYIAATDEFLSITLINHLLRTTGAFFIKRRVSGDRLYATILSEYMKQLLRDQQILEFFVEGTRSRTGKTLHPKFGLLSMCTEAFFEGEVQDIHFVPVTINYERVLEGETFPFELLGEEKVRESLLRVVKSSKILNMNFGKIYVTLSEPISIKAFSLSKVPSNQLVNQQAKDNINKLLGYEIVYRLQDHIMIMPTSLVAAILLMHRRGVSDDELVSKVEWLRDEIKIRGWKVGGVESGSAQASVRNAINHLGDTISHKKDVFEPSISMRDDYKNILLLSYYRNALHHIFIGEALCACALYSFGEKLAWNSGVSKERVIVETLFLWNLIEREFVSRFSGTKEEAIESSLKMLKKRGVLEEIEDKIKIKQNGELMISFLCSILWPVIDSYWVTLVFSLALRTRAHPKFEKALQNVQWFAENMYEERGLAFYESCSLENLKNALHTFEKMGVIEHSGPDKLLAISETYSKNEAKLEELLDHIGNFRKTSMTSTLSSYDELKRALLDEFPLMPKI